MDRGWWLRIPALGPLVCFVIALPIGLAAGRALEGTAKLHPWR